MTSIYSSSIQSTSKLRLPSNQTSSSGSGSGSDPDSDSNQQALARLVSRLEVRAKSQQQKARSVRGGGDGSQQIEQLCWASVGLLASVNRAGKWLDRCKSETALATRGGTSSFSLILNLLLNLLLSYRTSFQLQSLEKRLKAVSSSVQKNHSSLASNSSLQLPILAPNVSSFDNANANSYLSSSSSFQSFVSSASGSTELAGSVPRSKSMLTRPTASSSLLKDQSLSTSDAQQPHPSSFKERQMLKRKATLFEGLDMNEENGQRSEVDKGHESKENQAGSSVFIGTSKDGKKILRRTIENRSEDPYDDFIESEDEQQKPGEEVRNDQSQETKARVPSIKISEPSNATQQSEEDLEEYNQAPSKSQPASHVYPPPQSVDKDDAAAGEDSLLQSDRKTHDALSSELLRMASRLKENSLSFAEALERDRKLVEMTGEKLQGNLDLMTRTRGRLGDYAKKARGLGWFTFGSVLVVIFSWVLLFIVIKLT